jgi:anti-sigma factor RsiW
LSEELDLLLDGRLVLEDRRDVEAHLAGCASCRRQLDSLRSMKAVLHDSMQETHVPATLSARVAAALDRVDRESGRRGDRAHRVARPAALGLGLAAAALIAFLLLRGSGPDFVEGAADNFASARTGTLVMDLTTSDPIELERYFAEAGLPFATRVFDFAMMDYRLIGGRVLSVDGRPTALFVYRSEAGRYVVCQMYEGSLDELPAAREERENDGIRFRVYRAGTTTLVFWREGAVVCVLVSDGEPEAAIQLAFAKAVHVPSGGR